LFVSKLGGTWKKEECGFWCLNPWCALFAVDMTVMMVVYPFFGKGMRDWGFGFVLKGMEGFVVLRGKSRVSFF
jgi:hypothetical protein